MNASQVQDKEEKVEHSRFKTINRRVWKRHALFSLDVTAVYSLRKRDHGGNSREKTSTFLLPPFYQKEWRILDRIVDISFLETIRSES